MDWALIKYLNRARTITLIGVILGFTSCVPNISEPGKKQSIKKVDLEKKNTSVESSSYTTVSGKSTPSAETTEEIQTQNTVTSTVMSHSEEPEELKPNLSGAFPYKTLEEVQSHAIKNYLDWKYLCENEPGADLGDTLYQSWIERCRNIKYDWEAFYNGATAWPLVSHWHAGVVSTGHKSFVINAPPKDSNFIGVAGAGYLGKGKIVVIGDRNWIYYDMVQGFSPDSYLHRSSNTHIATFYAEKGASFAGREDEMKFAPIILRNIVTWLTKDSSIGYKATIDKGEPFKFLQNMSNYYHDWHPDYKMERIYVDDFTTTPSLLNPDIYPLVVVMSNKVKKQEEYELLKSYVERGGNILLAGSYWYDWPGLSETNQFLKNFDLHMTSVVYGTKLNYPLPTQESLDSVQDNLFSLYSLLKKENSGTGMSETEINDLLSKSSRLGNYSAPVSIPFNGLIVEFEKIEFNYPISSSDNKSKALVQLQYNLTTALPPHPIPKVDVSNFPGDVDPSAPRVEKSLSFDVLDGDRTADRNFRHSPPANWEFTGLYAPAGEIIEVDITSADNIGLEHFQVIINAHSDNIIEGKTLNGSVSRIPKVTTYHKGLKLGKNLIRNPFGGLIILNGWYKEASNKINITIRNAIEAAWLNETTTQADMDRMKLLHAPWAVIQSSRTVAVVPMENFKTISDFAGLRTAWQTQAERMMDAAGLTPNDPDPRHRYYKNRMWHVVDKQISVGYAHSGHPAMYHPDWNSRFVNPMNVLLDDWGLYHEQGHNMQFNGNKHSTDGEVTNNVFALYVIEKGGGELRTSVRNIYETHYSQLQAGPVNIYGLDPWHNLAWWHQLFQYTKLYPQSGSIVGFDIYKKMYRDFREMDNSFYDSLNNDQNKTDNLALMFSKYTKYNLISFFERWGRTISPEMKNQINTLGLPEPNPVVWTYTP